MGGWVDGIIGVSLGDIVRVFGSAEYVELTGFSDMMGGWSLPPTSKLSRRFECLFALRVESGLSLEHGSGSGDITVGGSWGFEDFKVSPWLA